MTLRTYPDIEQGSDEWRDIRRGIVTASTVGKLLTPSLTVANNDTSRGITASLVAERITGHTEETAMTADMWRGVECEPIARAKYAEHFAPVEEMGFMIREEPGWRIGYSPDGLVGEEGLIEIKSPRAKTHLRTILADRVPSQYMAQLQAGLLVSGREWIDFISYSGGMPMWTQRVTPDPKWFEVIVEAVIAFEERALDMVRDYRMEIVGLPETEYIDDSLAGIEF